MPKHLHFELDENQRRALVNLRDHSPKPCLRERSAIVLKIADGTSATEVATSGLYKARNLDTVLHWYWRYRQEGIDGLSNRRGQGRKPAFSPCVPRRSSRTRRAASPGPPRSA